MIRTIVFLALFIVALDAVESVISRSTGFPYPWFTIVQVLVYVTIGFVVRRRGGSVGQALVAAAVTAFAEATLGWAVSTVIRQTASPDIIEAILVVPVVVFIETALAAAGVGLASLGRGAR